MSAVMFDVVVVSVSDDNDARQLVTSLIIVSTLVINRVTITSSPDTHCVMSGSLLPQTIINPKLQHLLLSTLLDAEDLTSLC